MEQYHVLLRSEAGFARATVNADRAENAIGMARDLKHKLAFTPYPSIRDIHAIEVFADDMETTLLASWWEEGHVTHVEALEAHRHVAAFIRHMRQGRLVKAFRSAHTAIRIAA
jgi:hypothetical protein